LSIGFTITAADLLRAPPALHNRHMTSGPGLRERKKAKTRRAIQEAALRLFSAQGYDSTTVDQIADAAEVSPSTFFRYFPTKEDAVLVDDYDPLFVMAIAKAREVRQPIRAIRAAMVTAFAQVFEQDREQIYQRTKLTMTIPALRARLFEGTLETQQAIDDALAERSGQDVRDLDLRVLVAAAVAAMTVAVTTWAEGDGGDDLPALVDHALSLIDPDEPTS